MAAKLPALSTRNLLTAGVDGRPRADPRLLAVVLKAWRNQLAEAMAETASSDENPEKSETEAL